MTKPKLTPPFPGTVKPARRGVYQRRVMNAEQWRFAKWDGRSWHFGRLTEKEAAKCRDVSMFQHVGQWRGLAEKP